MRNLILGSTAIAVTLVASAADRVDAAEVIDAADPAVVLSIVRDFGGAALTKDGMGDPLINGSIGGNEYFLYFYDCKANRNCKSLMFLANREADDLSEAKVARWNREQRFGKVYIDDENRPAVEMNVNLEGGVTRDNLTGTLDWWRLILTEFSDY